MKNRIANHDVTRQQVLKRLAGIRRSCRKLRDKLREPGPMPAQARHEAYTHAEVMLKATQTTIRMLDEAKPTKDGT